MRFSIFFFLFLIIIGTASAQATVTISRSQATQLADWLEFGGGIAIMVGFFSLVWTLINGIGGDGNGETGSVPATSRPSQTRDNAPVRRQTASPPAAAPKEGKGRISGQVIDATQKIPINDVKVHIKEHPEIKDLTKPRDISEDIKNAPGILVLDNVPLSAVTVVLEKEKYHRNEIIVELSAEKRHIQSVFLLKSTEVRVPPEQYLDAFSKVLAAITHFHEDRLDAGAIKNSLKTYLEKNKDHPKHSQDIAKTMQNLNKIDGQLTELKKHLKIPSNDADRIKSLLQKLKDGQTLEQTEIENAKASIMAVGKSLDLSNNLLTHIIQGTHKAEGHLAAIINLPETSPDGIKRFMERTDPRSNEGVKDIVVLQSIFAAIHNEGHSLDQVAVQIKQAVFLFNELDAVIIP